MIQKGLIINTKFSSFEVVHHRTYAIVFNGVRGSLGTAKFAMNGVVLKSSACAPTVQHKLPRGRQDPRGDFFRNGVEVVHGASVDMTKMTYASPPLKLMAISVLPTRYECLDKDMVNRFLDIFFE